MCAALSCDADENIHVVTMSTGALDRDRGLALQCWDLEDLAADYRRFIDQCAEWTPLDPSELTAQEALVARVELVSAYRRFPFRDPQLPTALQPDGWPGDEAYEAFVRAHQALAGPATSYVSSVLTEPVRVSGTSPKTFA